jgi:ethanolamine ammonia-lyase small subunit
VSDKSDVLPPFPVLSTTPTPARLNTATTARVSLGITGPSIPTREQLRFQLDHAVARDAVHAQMETADLLQELRALQMETLVLRSAATSKPQQRNRRLYLLRPDLGRRLHPDSQNVLQEYATHAAVTPEIVFVISDGLSALAVERHAVPLLSATLCLLRPELRRIGPVCIVQQGRVAIGDEIGDLLKAKLIVLLIGERPGLSAADSLGVYLTWAPRPGRTDAERNCISNIRHEGLGYAEAAQRLVFYINEATRLENTGIALKEVPSLDNGSTSG